MKRIKSTLLFIALFCFGITTILAKSVTSISCDEELIVNKNLSYQLNCEVIPSDAENKQLKYSVNNNLVTVNKNGVLKVGNKLGTSIITVTSLDSGVTKNITVMIKPDLEEIVLDQNTYVLKAGKSITLIPTLNPSDAEVEVSELTWISNNTNIVSVSDGTITGVSKGEANITVSYRDISKNIKVIVLDGDEVKVSEITANNEITLMINKQAKLEYEIYPDNASVKDVTFKVNNSLISIDENGVITAGNKKGTSYVTIYSYDGKVKNSVKVNIIDEIKVSDITLPEEITIYKEEKGQIDYKVLPEDATNKQLKFSVNNDLITVSQTGVVEAKSEEGMSIVTVKSYDDTIIKTLRVYVITRLEKMTFEKNNYEIEIDGVEKLNLVLVPEDFKLDISTIQWSSSDDSIVEISQEGYAKAKKGGFVTVKATTSDGKVTASTSIKVPQKEASAFKIIFIIIIAIALPVIFVVLDYFRRKKLRSN